MIAVLMGGNIGRGEESQSVYLAFTDNIKTVCGQNTTVVAVLCCIIIISVTLSGFYLRERETKLTRKKVGRFLCGFE